MPRLPVVHPPQTTRPTLTPWDHLVLIGFQVKYNLKKAQEKWDQDFRDALKTYLMTRPADQRQLISAGVIKVSIVEKGGGPSLDVQLIENTFKNLFRNPPSGQALTTNDVTALFASGALGVKDPQAIKNFLEARGVLGEYTRPGNPELVSHELRWQVLSPNAEQGAGVLADLPERVHAASGARLDDGDIELMLPQARPLAENEPIPTITRTVMPPHAATHVDPVTGASETVAVRRPRRRNRRPEAPQPQADVVRRPPEQP